VEEELNPPGAGVPPIAVPPRPVPLPDGPVESYAARSAIAGLGGFAVTSAATLDPRRALSAAVAGNPKAAVHGREVFAAHSGRLLAARGVLTLDARVMRRLDRVDCLVIDGALVTGETDDAAEPEDAPAVDPHVAVMVERAHEAGWMVAVVGDDALVAALDADLRLDEDALASVRMLQEDGCVVALLSRDGRGLAAADVAIAPGRGPEVAWSADLLCSNLADAGRVVEVATAAHEVSRQSAALALAGSSVAAILGFTIAAPEGVRRATIAVNVASLVAQANGFRVAWSLGRLPPPVRPSVPPWHEVDGGAVLELVGSSPAGLRRRQALARRPEEAAAPLSLPAAMVEELANPLTPVLLGAAALAGALGSATDAAIVGSVTFVNAAVGGVQRWRVDRAVRDLEERSGQQVRVLRDGRPVVLSAEALAVGDVVTLSSGDSVPADARILSTAGLEVDESSLTGESVPVAKSADPVRSDLVAERSSMLYDGTLIAVGEADAVVVAVGADTEAGAAAASARADGGSSGVERRLADLTRRALPVSLLGGAAVTGAGLLRAVPVRQSLYSGVALAVAAVPEGLPLLATMAQISAARRLAARGVLVRNPRAIEALGRVDVLCADKTGTLTQGRISLALVSDGARVVRVDDVDERLRPVLIAALRASPAERDDHDPLPHLTDRAVVEGASRAGVTAENATGWRRLDELAFEPARGYHAVLGSDREVFVLSVKGAPEVVVPRCATWHDGSTVGALDDAVRAQLAEHVDRLARQGYRVLAAAERTADGRQDLDDERVDGLDLLGFVALADPVRPAAADAVTRLGDAGVRTVMVTGDHPSTAEGIAHELSLLDGGRVVTGAELDAMADPELATVLPDVTVFARVTPAQKLRLVTAYQAAGHGVAMTGDGANDAPAIRRADVGVALGEHSTSGARRAADLVVPGNQLEVLLDAVVEGRAMWASLREAVAILLGGNVGEAAFTVAGAVITGRAPLNPRQLLLVNLLTDALPAMAIATRGPRDVSPEALLAEGPDASLARSLERAVVGRALTTAGAATAAWLGARVTGRGARASTVALAALVGTQLGQTLMTGRDPVVVACAVGSWAALVVTIETPGLSQAFGCTPLGPVAWSMVGGASLLGVAASPLVSRVVGAVMPDGVV
ncbi:MAG: ctpI, partial [Acidimicrobiales bacterium]|nr:ctpI [Acidimicrobiales bacterium]